MSVTHEEYIARGYEALSELEVDELSTDAVYGGYPLYRSFSTLRSSRVTTLILLFFCAPAGHDAIFRLAASPGAGHVQSLINYKALELRSEFGLSVAELRSVTDALVRLAHAHAYAYGHGLIGDTLPRAWYPHAVSMPGRDDTPGVYEALSRAARETFSHRLDYLFPYEWPFFGVDAFGVPKHEKMSHRFVICRTLQDVPVATLRHYLFDRQDDDLLVLAKLSRNSVTDTIGHLVDNTPDWIDRHFGVGERQMVRLLGSVRSLEYALIMLSELKRHRLA